MTLSSRLRCSSALTLVRLEYPSWDPVGHCLFLRAKADGVGDEAPPLALFAQRPAGQLAFDNLVHLDAGGMVAAGEVWLAGEQGDQIDQDGRGWPYDTERVTDGLTAVADRLHLTHVSIICSNDRTRRPTGLLHPAESGRSSSRVVSSGHRQLLNAHVGSGASPVNHRDAGHCHALKLVRMFANHRGLQGKSKICRQTRKARGNRAQLAKLVRDTGIELVPIPTFLVTV